MVDVRNQHAELQEPAYMEGTVHKLFQTGPLPVGLLMDEDYHYDDITDRPLVHPPMLNEDFNYSARSEDDDATTGMYS